MEVMINQFKRLCEMVAIGYNNFRVIAFQGNDHPLALLYGVNFIAVYNNPDI